jgi:surface antigen
MRLVIVSMCVLVAACASNNDPNASIPGDGEQTGISGGAPWLLPPGPRSDSQVASLPPDIAIPMQGLAGSWSGGKLGDQLTMDARDRMIDLTQSALNQGQSGKKVKWREGKLTGTIIPQIAFSGPNSLDCREFHQTLRLGDVVETGYATACRAPDGKWRLLSE